MIARLTDFLVSGLRPYLEGTQRLHVLFATYNNVRMHESGPVETLKDGLTIQVQNGNLDYSTFAVFGPLSSNFAVSRLALDQGDVEARAAERAMKSSLSLEREENAPLLAFVYAGASAFREAFDTAAGIKRDNPGSRVVVLTCDCNLEWKEHDMQPRISDGEIDQMIVTRECGGRDGMRLILDSVVEQWQPPVAEAASQR